jgi:exodeoxyribonuclease VII large subunit
MKQMNLDLKDIEEKTHQKMEAEIDVSGAEVVEQQGPRVYAVSQLNQVIRQLLEGQFEFLWIQGEISNFKAHPSGHYYFSLKDKKAQISAVMFKGFNRHLKFKPKDGIEVLVRGKVSVYEQRGNYQILCETMEPLGAGSLQIAFEQLKSKLQKEGLFDEARKRSLPTFPEHVALVTAPSGAAIRDMLNVLRRRSRGLRITVIPAIVQGGQAPESIVKGIENANRLSDVDVIIIGRGGGSIEDLWGFNEEQVARAIASSKRPIISAVGHEIDFTIADFVADLRAPTPSAAAELVVKNTDDLITALHICSRRLYLALQRRIQFFRHKIESVSGRLTDPRRKLRDLILRCDELTERLGYAMLLRLERSRSQWEHFSTLLDSLSPLRVVERGYAILRGRDNHIIKKIQGVVVGSVVQIQVADGVIEAEVSRVRSVQIKREFT